MLPAFGTLAVTVPVGTKDHTASTKVCTYAHTYIQTQKHVYIQQLTQEILTVHTYVHNCRL